MCHGPYDGGCRGDLRYRPFGIYLFRPDDAKVNIIWEDVMLEASIFNDVLEPFCKTVDILGRYDSSYYKDKPGLTLNRIGKGKAYYFGGAFTERTASVFLRKLGVNSPFSDLIDAPKECEMTIREMDGRRYIFVLNYEKEAVTINIRQPILIFLPAGKSKERYRYKIMKPKYLYHRLDRWFEYVLILFDM